GGETNAGTGYESTNYYIVLPSRNLETALDIHADVLQYSVFDEFELEKERQVLIQENAMYRDRPNGFGFTWEELLAEAFTVHRYQRPIGGPDENLLRVGREDILRYKEHYYLPNNLVYVVVGDVEAEEVFRLLEAKLGKWQPRALVPDRSMPEPPQTRLRYREKTGAVEKSYVKVGFHIPSELEPDTDALLVLSHILATGRSSRLYREVREKQALILSSQVMETTGREPGYMVVEFTAEPEKRDDALVAVMTEILKFQREPVEAEEIDRTLRSVRNDTLYTLETMEGQAQMLGHYALLGDYRLAGNYLDRLARVSPQAIQSAARRYLRLEQATVFAYGPEKQAPLAGTADALFARLGETTAARLTGAIAEAPAVTRRTDVPLGSGRARSAVESVTLPQGTRVLLQADGRLPLTAMAAYLPLGSGIEIPSEAGITRLMQATMLKGAAGRDATSIAEVLDRLGARVRPLSDRDTAGWSLGVARDDFQEAFRILRDVLTQPDFPAEAVARERERTVAEIASLSDETVQYTITQLFEMLFPAHAYGRPSLGTEGAVARISPEDLAAWHRRHYDPSRMVVSVVGDFERDLVLRELESLAAGLPRSAEQREVLPVTHPTEPVRTERAQEVAQAIVVIGYPGLPVLSPERYALDVWQTILSGMGNRLFTRLRDEMHLCYFTGAFVASFRRAGAVGAYVGTAPDQVESATDALLEEMERTVHELPDEEEMERAKNTIAGNHLIDLQTRMSWASSYAHDEVLGLGYEEVLRYLDRIRAVTGEDVREAAARVIDAKRLAMAVLKPADPASVEQTVGA
ncbi:MAG TPA: pitrilysin family protein, partial [Candidatus Eisenbacteria bacterium]|nr:pitrilysin family protein [Candidatus Eisenbacteria bacterium]